MLEKCFSTTNYFKYLYHVIFIYIITFILFFLNILILLYKCKPSVSSSEKKIPKQEFDSRVKVSKETVVLR